MVKKYKEFLLLIIVGTGAITFMFCFTFFLVYSRDVSSPNLGLQLFLIFLMVMGALMAIGSVLLYFLYLQKRWYGNATK